MAVNNIHEQSISMALAGNPNAGKTTLFNQLTGARQHVGNYPGITVDCKEGYLKQDGQNIKLVDLPGTYSLTAYSVEELVARDYLVNAKPQVVINIVDASNLERNLYLTSQFLELGVPMVIALNMIDVARDRGIVIKADKLAQLLSVPVIPIIARSGQGCIDLVKAAIKVASEVREWKPIDISYGDDLDETIRELVELIEQNKFLTVFYPARFTAIKWLENDEQIISKGTAVDSGFSRSIDKRVNLVTDHLQKTMEMYPEALIADHRYGFIKSIIRDNVQVHKFDTDRLYTSDKIDKIVTNRLLGPVIMLLVILGLFHFTFSGSELPVSMLEAFFGWLRGATETLLPDGPVKSMIISGVIDGVGGVFSFVPLILFMFFGIAFLEDSGYLARVAFMLDRIFRIFGLHGSSVMPFIVSGGIAGGCAVPGVLATRTLRSPKERMATLLTAPFMNCGAKVPVMALIIGTFFAKNKAFYMFLFTLLTWVVALLVSKFYRLTVLRGEPTPFVMELPPYRLPTLRGLLIHTWERTWQYIKKAGTVILTISILLWALMTFPALPEKDRNQFKQKRIEIVAKYSHDTIIELNSGTKDLSEQARLLREQLKQLEWQESETALRHSIGGQIGTSLESISHLAGFDWRTNIALVGGFAAKEVIISTLGTAYSMGKLSAEKADSLSKQLLNDPGWNKVSAVAALVFIMFYAPCFVTVVCIAKESSWGWAVFSMTFNTVFAFLVAVFVFQTGSALGFG